MSHCALFFRWTNGPLYAEAVRLALVLINVVELDDCCSTLQTTLGPRVWRIIRVVITARRAAHAGERDDCSADYL
jgi:hypothetical protein